MIRYVLHGPTAMYVSMNGARKAYIGSNDASGGLRGITLHRRDRCTDIPIDIQLKRIYHIIDAGEAIAALKRTQDRTAVIHDELINVAVIRGFR